MIRKLLLWLSLGLSAAAVPGWEFYATDLEAYRSELDLHTAHSGRGSLHLCSTPAATSAGYGLFWQKIDAAPYRGRRLRLSGFLRTTGVSGWAGMWMRVDPKYGPTLEFDNMQRRPVQGSTDWKQYQIELDVAPQAEQIHLGFLLVGRGEVWFDDLRLDRLGPALPGAELLRRARHLPAEPQNPGFEDQTGNNSGASPPPPSDPEELP